MRNKNKMLKENKKCMKEMKMRCRGCKHEIRGVQELKKTKKQRNEMGQSARPS
jgi:hypothetical protein